MFATSSDPNTIADTTLGVALLDDLQAFSANGINSAAEVIYVNGSDAVLIGSGGTDSNGTSIDIYQLTVAANELPNFNSLATSAANGDFVGTGLFGLNTPVFGVTSPDADGDSIASGTGGNSFTIPNTDGLALATGFHTTVVVPEPSHTAPIIVAAGLAGLTRRRRRS